MDVEFVQYMLSGDGNMQISYEPSYFSSDSNYFVTLILKNIKITKSDLTKKFTVTPYWVTLDGTTVYGTTRNDITIQAGIDANNENQ